MGHRENSYSRRIAVCPGCGRASLAPLPGMLQVGFVVRADGDERSNGVVYRHARECRHCGSVLLGDPAGCSRQ
jgi:ribosomal protein S27AE